MGGGWGRRAGRKSQGRGAPALHGWVCHEPGRHEPGRSQTLWGQGGVPFGWGAGGRVLLLTLFVVFSLASSPPVVLGMWTGALGEPAWTDPRFHSPQPL